MRKAIIFLGVLVILSSFATADLDTGLVEYWSFEQDPSTSDLIDVAPSGTNDSTSDSVRGRVAGGLNDYAWNFSKANTDNVIMPTTVLNTMSEYSICGWVWFRTKAQPDCPFWASDLAGYHTAFWLVDGNYLKARMTTTTSTGSVHDIGQFPTAPSVSRWIHLCLTYDGVYARAFLNASEVVSDARTGTALTNDWFEFGSRTAEGFYLDGYLDEWGVWNRNLTKSEIEELWDSGTGTFCTGDPCTFGVADTTPPVLSEFNCTSCDVPNGDTSSPYETEDTTPTFRFNTSENAYCAIGKYDQNYTTMGASRNCSGEGGTKGHSCSLTVQDRFNSTGNNNIYISCRDDSYNENKTSSSGPLMMNILGASETGGDGAIDIGIAASEIGGTATIYSNKRVSARNLANDQFTGLFDRVAVKDNKRWAFNYVSSEESPITELFNISPILYVLQLQNETNETITDQVGKLINSTWP